MKKISFLLITLGFLFGCLLLLFIYTKRVKEIEQKTLLPGFVFTTLENLSFTNDSIPKDTKLFAINHFQPDCHFCEDFAKSLIYSRVEFGFSNLLIMVTNAQRNELNSFLKKYPINKIPRLVILQDTTFMFHHYFGVGSVPCTFLYDSNRFLIDQFIGEFPFEKLCNGQK